MYIFRLRDHMQMINKVSCSQGYEFLLRASASQVILQDLLQTKTKNEHGTKITAQLWCGNRPKTFLGFGTLEPFFHISALFKFPGFLRRSVSWTISHLHLNASRALILELQHSSLCYAT